MRPHAREDNLLVETIGDEILVYDLDLHRAHRLSRSAAIIWRHCDGEHTVADLTRVVAVNLGIDPDERVVWLVLSELERTRLLRTLLLRPKEIGAISRRHALSLGLAGAATLLLGGCGVNSVSAPSPIGSGPAPGGPETLSGVQGLKPDPTPSPTPTPLPSPSPPPFAECPGRFLFPNPIGESGQGANNDEATSDLFANARKHCDKLCKKKKCAGQKQDCVFGGVLVQLSSFACVTDPNEPNPKKRVTCVETIFGCDCDCSGP